MSTAPPPPRAARLALSLAFFLNGAVLATWVSRIPDIKRHLHLSDGQLGLALLGMAAGAIVAFPVTGALTARHGSRAVTVVAAACYLLTLPVLALAPSLAALTLTLVFFGMFNGAMDVAMNAHGVEVEQRYARPILSSLHGTFSLGGLTGAALGAAAAHHDWSTLQHYLSAALVLGAALLGAAPRLLPSAPTHRSGDPLFAWPSRALLGFGLIAFCAHLSEGAMADWSAVYLRDTLGTGAAFAATGYAAFSLTMTLARFTGDTLISRLGPVRTVRTGGLLAGLGLGAALLTPSPALTLVGFACVGLGMATLSPLVFSAAGRTPGVPPGTAIAAVATMGYSGFLAGPPVIGLIAQVTTLRFSLGLVALLGLVIALLGAQVRRATLPGQPDPGALDVAR